MDSASKNASDMIGRLQMQFNRGRQASITNELVDIITGLLSPRQFVRGVTETPSRCQRLVNSEDSLESGIDSVFWRNPVICRFPSSLIVLWTGSSEKWCSFTFSVTLISVNLDRGSDSFALIHEIWT
jgi:hypothetical protein